MTTTELIEALEQVQVHQSDDPEQAHIEADALLLLYIDNSRVKQLHDELAAWYA